MEVTSKKQADWIHNNKIFQEGEKNSAKRTPLHLIIWAHTSSFCTYFPKLNTTLLLAMSSHWLIFNHGHLNICCFNWAIALSLPSLPVVKLEVLCRCFQPAATLHPQKLTGKPEVVRGICPLQKAATSAHTQSRLIQLYRNGSFERKQNSDYILAEVLARWVRGCLSELPGPDLINN